MTNKTEDTNLVISAIGTDQPGIVNQLSKLCAESDCNIVDSRMTVLGGEFAVIMLISGNWDSVAKLEGALPALADQLNLTTTAKRTGKRQTSEAFSYTVNVVALDNPGIVHEISQFFSAQKINIDDLVTGTYSAPHTGTQMFNLNMLIQIPANTHIASLREEFMDFCDDRNLDAVIEPQR